MRKNGILMALAGCCAWAVFADDGVCEDELVLTSDVQDVKIVQDADLRACWPAEALAEIPIPVTYSAVGWDLVPQSAGATVRLRLQDGEFEDGSFSPGADSRDLAAGLSGKGVFNWVPEAVGGKIYRVVHEATRDGKLVSSETLSAYFDFTNYGEHLDPLVIRRAVLGVTQPIDYCREGGCPWSCIGGEGDGLKNSADFGTLSFGFMGVGPFVAELSVADGEVLVSIDGETVATIGTTAGWMEFAWPVDDFGEHKVIFRHAAGESDAAVGIRNVRRCGEVSVNLADGQGANVRMDLRDGVRAPKFFNEILPFSYSPTNWIGDVTGTGALVSIVPLVGMDPDVTKWSAAGEPSTLFDGADEGSVKWNPEKGVWKATFEIPGTSHREETWFDLRKSRALGFMLMVF